MIKVNAHTQVHTYAHTFAYIQKHMQGVGSQNQAAQRVKANQAAARAGGAALKAGSRLL